MWSQPFVAITPRSRLEVLVWKLFELKRNTWNYVSSGSLAKWVESSPMARETRVRSQVASYQRLKKWYLLPPCLTLSIIRYISSVKWSNLGKGVAPSLTPPFSSYWKESLRVTLDYSRQLYLTFMWVCKLLILRIANWS